MVVRRAPLHVVAMRLRVVTEGQWVAGLAERMAGQGATQAGRRDETHPWLGRGQAEVCTERFTATRLGSLNPKIVHPLRKIVNPQAACGRL